MKFKVGDRVRIRKDLKVSVHYGYDIFISDMSDYRGKEAIVTDIHEYCPEGQAYLLDIDNGVWNWTEEMLENDAVKPKITCDEGNFSRICGHCGKILGIFDNYCSKCGTKIDKTPDIYEDALDWLIEKIYNNGIELKDLPEIESYYDEVERLSEREKLKWVSLQEGIKSRKGY